MTLKIYCDGELVAVCNSEEMALRVSVGLTDYDMMDIVDDKGQHYAVSDDLTRLVPCEAP